MKFKFLLSLVMLSASVYAKDPLTVSWGFGAGGFGGQLSKTMIEVAHQQQSEETFVFDHRPGAGGAIAARHVQSNKNAVLQGSGSFFIRPNFYPAESHDPKQFQPLMLQCATPFLVLSAKHQRWKDIDTQAKITVGVPGMGSTNHLIALKLSERYPNLTVVPYKGVADSLVDVLSGTIDMIISNPEGIMPQVEAGKLTALGTTGATKIGNIATLTSQGFSSDLQRMNTMHFLAVPVDMPVPQTEKLRQIFVQTNKDVKVQQLYERNFCASPNLTPSKTAEWFAAEQQFWKNLTQNVVIAVDKK